MSTTPPTQMPERLDFLRISQDLQVLYDDQPQWLHDAINTALDEAAKKAVRFQKKCSVMIELNLTPGPLNHMKVEAVLNMKEPKKATLPLLAYTDTSGRLFGEDPNQMRLALDKTVQMKGK